MGITDHKKASILMNALYITDAYFLLNSCISAIYQVISACHK